MGGMETIKKLLEIDPEVKAVVSSEYSDDAALATYEQQGFKAGIAFMWIKISTLFFVNYQPIFNNKLPCLRQ
jgi:hypothetical protein